MDSARFAIDSDDVFYLEHLPVINGLVEAGLTLFVDKDFPNYHDMTLIQYAIAKRKPKTLEFLLNKAKEIKIKEEDIMYPKTSNTRGSLLILAIKFGSKSDYYDSEDNCCLKVIIQLLSISKTKNLEKPLIEAVRNKNNDAIDILIQNKADFFSPLDTDTNDIEDDLMLSEMPIMSLFKLHNNEEELAEIFDKILPKEKYNEIIDRLTILKVKGREFITCLSKVERAKNFCAGRIENREQEIRRIEEEKRKKTPNQPEPPNPTEKTNQSGSSKHVCAECGAEGDLQLIGGRFLCSNCNPNN